MSTRLTLAAMSALPQSKKAKGPAIITKRGRYLREDKSIVTITPSGYTRESDCRWWCGAECRLYGDDGTRWENGPGPAIIAPATESRTPAKPKAARQGRYYTERGHSFWSVTDRTKGPGVERLVAICMTRSTARKLAALMNREAK